jgi:uncharacterized protein YdbL (DUF1318 family)
MPKLREAAPRSFRSRFGRAALAVPAFVAMACVTVNIYFPAPEVRQAAERIVDETWGATAPSAPAADGQAVPDSGPRSSLAARLTVAAIEAILPGDAEAADVNVNVSTAAIRALKDAMKQRAAELKPLLAAGGAGIGRDGMLAARDAAGLDLATRAKIRRLVDAENKDRESLYREIATANNFGSERVADIRSIFAQTWKDKAEPGWWVQGADGSWKRK